MVYNDEQARRMVLCPPETSFCHLQAEEVEDKSVEEELTMFLYTCFAVSFRFASNVIKISESQKSRYIPEFQSIKSEP